MRKEKIKREAEKLVEIKQVWLNWREQQLQKQSSENQLYEKMKEKEKKLLSEINARMIESMSKRIFGEWVTTEEEIDEYDSYTTDPCLSGIKSPLAWWCTSVRHDCWPNLSEFAIKTLSFPPMSDEAEWIFSGTHCIIS